MNDIKYSDLFKLIDSCEELNTPNANGAIWKDDLIKLIEEYRKAQQKDLANQINSF